MLKKSRVLITGGAGFIGSELALHAAGHGAAVTVVDNLVNGKRENLPACLNDQVQFVACDIRDSARMAELLRNIQMCETFDPLSHRES
jgi:UDP-glucose 4-epimerase